MFRRIFTVLFVCLLLAACGGGGGGGSDSQDFSVSPTNLTFTAAIDGDETPPAQTITLKAKGANVSPPDVREYSDFISCTTSFSDADTMEVTVAVGHPVVVGVGKHVATITLSNGSFSQNVSVTYDITAADSSPGSPVVNFVAPRPVLENTSTELIIRGGGFSLIGAGVTPEIFFGATEGSDIQIINDSEIRVTAPPLAAGTYNVQLLVTGLIYDSIAELLIVVPQSFATTEIPTSGEKSKMIFDAERKKLYIVNATDATLEIYSYQSGTNWILQELAIPSLTDAALSPDGKMLVAVNGSSFYEIDLEATTLNAQFITAKPESYINDEVTQIDFLNNGTAVSIGPTFDYSYVYTYELLTHGARKDPYIINWVIDPSQFSVADGSAVYIGEGNSYGGLLQYEATTFTLLDLGLGNPMAPGIHDASFNNDQSLFILNAEKIYDASLNLLATLPVITGNYSFNGGQSTAAISPDGAVVYVYDYWYNVLRAYDLSDPSTPAQIGDDVILTNSPGYQPKIGNPPALKPRIGVSADGNTLFLVGSEYLHVIGLSTFVF